MLLISCFVSGYLFFAASENPLQQLTDLAQADSLIKKELSNFNIGEQQVNIITTKVDSNLSRKTYYVSLPPAFSKTQLHAELNRVFYPYSIKTPATATFPEKNITINFLWFDTVIRTVKLQTDPELVLNRKQARILMIFNSKPEDELISQLASLGEPIPMVIKVTNPMQVKELSQQLDDQYKGIFFQFRNEQREDFSTGDKLEELQDFLPSAMMVQVSSSKNIEPLSKAGPAFIDAKDALILNEEMGKASFFKALSRLKTDQPHPLIIIKGSETTLNWLSEKLPELKKAGVRLMHPSAMDF
ncbi:MAG TPA: hypothetical protein VFG39_06265 [Balneolaceae bacterium]|nr:hypothetical protein [Balneolaceae bacterium]